MARLVRPEFLSLYQWKDLVQASRKSGENGSPSKLIQIFGLDLPEVQMYCVPFNNVTILTALAVLMESALRA